MFKLNRIQGIRANDEVAVLRSDDTGQHVLAIARVKRVGPTLIHTDDGDFYSTYDGEGMGKSRVRHIEPATNDHRKALHTNRRKVQTKVIG